MIRKARIQDVDDIKTLLSKYARKGLLLDRSIMRLYESIRDFFVAEHNGKFVGCCALHIYWNDLAEIRSLAVKPRFKDRGFGKEMVEACLAEAKQLGLEKVFTFTFVPQFFKNTASGQ